MKKSFFTLVLPVSFFSLFPLVQLRAAPPSALAPSIGYESTMQRLGEVLGSLQLLDQLCGQKTQPWRGTLEKLLKNYNGSLEQRNQIIAYYNYGYKSLKENHRTCTPIAKRARAKYSTELQQLTKELLSKYRAQ